MNLTSANTFCVSNGSFGNLERVPRAAIPDIGFSIGVSIGVGSALVVLIDRFAVAFHVFVRKAPVLNKLLFSLTDPRLRPRLTAAGGTTHERNDANE